VDAFNKKYEPTDPAWLYPEETREEKRGLHESLFTLSNGFWGMRAINEDLPEGTRPGTFMAGIFDKSECVAVEMVNLPNPLPFYLVLDGKKIDLRSGGTVVSHRRILDMKGGALFRETVYRTGKKETRLRSLRFVSRDDDRLAAMKIEITPLNWSGPAMVRAELDGGVTNAFGSYFADERIKHFVLEDINDNYDPDVCLRVRVRDRGHVIAFATRLEAGAAVSARRRKIYGERVVDELDFPAEKGKPVEFTKYISVLDSRDCPPDELRRRVTNSLNAAVGETFDVLLARHRAAWEKRWSQADVLVEAEGKEAAGLQAKIRWNLYQLLILGSEEHYRHGIGIKGFTGEMYRGHFFWDTEVYLYPFYLQTNLGVARNLLRFRHSILDKARENARERGFRGMLYNWECDELGNEGINPEINRETGVMRRRETLDQLHVNLAVCHALLSYYRATQDFELLASCGLEILLENARFWASKLEYSEKLKAWEVRGVVGPDEYHVDLDNNYYTNFMLRRVLRRTLELLDSDEPEQQNAAFKARRALGVAEEEVAEWREMAAKIYLPEAKDGVLEQFSGYFDLEDYQVSKYNEYGIPVVVELEHLKDPAHPDYVPTLTHYNEALVRMARGMRIIKQADTILVFALAPEAFEEDVQRKTLLFYEPRTLHYSSLSPGVYALVAARLGEMELAEKHFRLALIMDLEDVKKEAATALHPPTQGVV